MKILWPTLFAVMCSTGMMAQTNATLSVGAGLKTYADSDSGYIDLMGRVMVWRGNVRVNDPKLKLTCELLTAQVPKDGGHFDNAVAETNVVVEMLDEQGRTNHATGDKLVYTYKVENGTTNEMATLTGNSPRLDTPDGWATADLITFDLISRKIRLEGHYHIEPQGADTTNSPPSEVERPKP